MSTSSNLLPTGDNATQPSSIESSATGAAVVATAAVARASASLYVVELHSTDVLLGRGSRIDQYPGNLHYRAQVSKWKEAYAASTNNDRKKEIADLIIAGIAERRGRFLRRVVSPSDEATQLHIPDGVHAWVEIDHSTAVEKTKQALREKGAAVKRIMARKLESASAVAGGAARESFNGVAHRGGIAGSPLDQFAVATASNTMLLQASRAIASNPNVTHSLLGTPLGGNVSANELQLLQSLVARHHSNSQRNSVASATGAPVTTAQSLWWLQRQLERHDLERRMQQERMQTNSFQQQLAAMQRRQLEPWTREPAPLGNGSVAFHPALSHPLRTSTSDIWSALRHRGMDHPVSSSTGGPDDVNRWLQPPQQSAPVVSNSTGATLGMERLSSHSTSGVSSLSQRATTNDKESLQQLLMAIQQQQREGNSAGKS